MILKVDHIKLKISWKYIYFNEPDSESEEFDSTDDITNESANEALEILLSIGNNLQNAAYAPVHTLHILLDRQCA